MTEAGPGHPEGTLRESRARRLLSFWKDAALYAMSPLLGVLSPLLVIPIVTSGFGAQGWVAVALGQSVGFFGAAVVEFGWPLAGPERLRSATLAQRHDAYWASVHARALVFVPVAVGCYFAAASIPSGAPITAGLTAVAIATTGLGATWFHTALGSPIPLLFREAMVRAVSSPLGAVVAILTGHLVLLPVVQLFFWAISLLLISWPLRRPRGLQLGKGRVRTALAVLGEQRGLATVRIATNAAYMLPTSIVGVVAPGQVIGFAAADRLMKLELAGVMPVLQVLQSRLGVGRRDPLRPVVVAVGCLALVAGGGYVASAGFLTSVLFTGTVAHSLAISGLFGLVFALVIMNRGLQLLLAGFLPPRSGAAVTAVAASVMTLLAAALGGLSDGAVGAVIGVAIGETAMLIGMGRLFHRHRVAIRARLRELSLSLPKGAA